MRVDSDICSKILLWINCLEYFSPKQNDWAMKPYLTYNIDTLSQGFLSFTHSSTKFMIFAINMSLELLLNIFLYFNLPFKTVYLNIKFYTTYLKAKLV